MSFDPILLRQQFSILSLNANGHDLVYLDNAATTQKPNCVLAAIMDYYQTSNANVHRGTHFLSDKATNCFEQARISLAHFIKAPTESHIIWSKGATEAINIVAYGIEGQLEAGDEILISSLEHHANLVPWQQLAKRTGAILRILPFDLCLGSSLNTASTLPLTSPLTNDDPWENSLKKEYSEYFTSKTKLFACTQVSNAIGTELPIQKLIQLAQSVGALTLIDGAQAVAHYLVNVSELDCDFYVFSGHKMYGPTGIGVLYGKTQALEQLTPYQTGGEMVQQVSYQETVFNQLPYRLEAGTPHIEGAIGLAAACDFLQSHDRQALLAWEKHLAKRVYQALSNRKPKKEPSRELNKELLKKNIQIYSPEDSTMVSFTVAGISPTDLNGFLDSKGIAVRSGQHCAHPLMTELGISGTIRASFACYNTEQEVDYFIKTLFEAIELLEEE